MLAVAKIGPHETSRRYTRSIYGSSYTVVTVIRCRRAVSAAIRLQARVRFCITTAVAGTATIRPTLIGMLAIL